jgi:hypothetical protein
MLLAKHSSGLTTAALVGRLVVRDALLGLELLYPIWRTPMG